MQKKKPIINVSHDVMTRRSYTLTTAATRILESYALFLSDHMDFRVSTGDILSKLVLKLSKDKVYVEWLREKDLRPKGLGASARASGIALGD